MAFPEWNAQLSVWKTTGKESSEACAIACQNCAVYSVFPPGMTSPSKIAQFNWECIVPFTAVQRYRITAVELQCCRLSSLLWRHPLCLSRSPISNLWLVCYTRHNKFVSWSLRFLKRFVCQEKKASTVFTYYYAVSGVFVTLVNDQLDARFFYFIIRLLQY